MQDNKIILCVGDISENTAIQCRNISLQYGLPYCGMADKKFESSGCYHVSLGDKSIAEVEELISLANEVIFLENQLQDDLDKQTQVLKNTLGSDQYKREKISEDNILFIGCSHTYGTGHDTTDTVYPSIVAKKLNLTPMVKGFPGQGNFKFEDVLTEYELGKNTNVIIQFTDIFRLRYYDDASESIIHKQGIHFSREETNMFTNKRLTYEFKQLVCRVVSRLRDANVNFLFFQLTHEHDRILDTNLFLSSFKEYCWTPDVAVDLASDNLHFGIESNKKIADRLIKKWNSLYAKTA